MCHFVAKNINKNCSYALALPIQDPLVICDPQTPNAIFLRAPYVLNRSTLGYPALQIHSLPSHRSNAFSLDTD